MEDRFKFRHWNKAVKEFTYYDNPQLQVCINKDFESGLIFPLAENQSLYMGTYQELQQCTGLKDKNGKLIYEGDIVFKKGNKFNGEKYNSKVIFDEMYAAFNISDMNGIHQMPTNSNNIEIIGNIYENSDLLSEVEG